MTEACDASHFGTMTRLGSIARKIEVRVNVEIVV